MTEYTNRERSYGDGRQTFPFHMPSAPERLAQVPGLEARIGSAPCGIEMEHNTDPPFSGQQATFLF